jgi:hypothetical protein
MLVLHLRSPLIILRLLSLLLQLQLLLLLLLLQLVWSCFGIFGYYLVLSLLFHGFSCFLIFLLMSSFFVVLGSWGCNNSNNNSNNINFIWVLLHICFFGKIDATLSKYVEYCAGQDPSTGSTGENMHGARPQNCPHWFATSTIGATCNEE